MDYKIIYLTLTFLFGYLISAEADTLKKITTERKFVEINNVELGSLLYKERSSGCSCSFHLPGEAFVPFDSPYGEQMRVLEWELGAGEIAYIHLNGKSKKLKLVKEVEDEEYKLGSKVSYFLEGKGIKVTVKGVTDFVCPSNSESCERTGYAGNLYIKTKQISSVIPMEGGCGC